MMDIVKILYLAFLLVLLYFLTVRIFIRKEPLGKLEWIIALLAVGISLVLYVRFMIHDLQILAPSDEDQYVTIVEELSKGKNPPISGPGFVYVLLLIRSISGWPARDITAVLGLLIGSIFPLLLYFLFRYISGSREEAVYSCLLALSTSYLLWPMIESRPQQLGMLLVPASAYFYHTYLKERRHLVPFVILASLTFLFHILSFLVLAGILLFVWWFHYIDDRVGLKEVKWPGIVMVLGTIIFVGPFPIYSDTYGGVKWMIRNSYVDLLSKPYLLVICLGIIAAILVALTIMMKRMRPVERLRELGKRYVGKTIPFIIGLLILILTIQFFLNKDVHVQKYRGSVILFLIFQVGNVVFGGLFIRAYYTRIKEGGWDDPSFLFTSALMLLGMVTLFFSIFLPMDFNNWVIRLINYWTVFAAPMIAKTLMDISPRSRYLLGLILPVLIVLGLMNISRDQTIFGYP